MHYKYSSLIEIEYITFLNHLKILNAITKKDQEVRLKKLLKLKIILRRMSLSVHIIQEVKRKLIN